MEREDNVVDINAYRQKNLAKIQNEIGKTAKKIEKRNRVHSTDVALMVGTAIFFDTLQALLSLIPIIGWILSSLVSVFAWLTFYVWSSAKGWGMSDSVKQFVVKWALPAFEIIPIGNIAPIWTIRTILQLSMLKAEDTLYNATEGKADLEKIGKLYKVYKKVA